jgi:hypothetical protein
MIRRKSLSTTDRDLQIDETLLDVQDRKCRSAYEAENILGLPKSSVTCRASEGPTRSQARQL